MLGECVAVDLVFENCASVHIPKKYIYLSMEDYQKSFQLDTHSNRSETTEGFDKILIAISHDINKSGIEQPELWGKRGNTYDPNGEEELLTTINRHDITCIELQFKKPDKKELYYTSWNPGDTNENSWQRNIKNSNGDMLITIGQLNEPPYADYFDSQIHWFKAGVLI